MIEENFEVIYKAFRLELYRHVFSILGEKSGSVSATEYFSLEVVYLLGNPTITEFADFLRISSPNAAYKVKSLIEKGYLEKSQTSDKRSFRLSVTEKFMQYYHKSDSYGSFIMKMLTPRMTADEIQQIDRLFEKFISQISESKEAIND